MSPDHQKSIFCVPGPPKINIFSPRITKIKQKSLFSFSGRQKVNMFSPGPPKINIVCSADHQKSIFSFPGAPKINNFSTLTTKLDLKSLFCVSGRPNINVFYPGSPKINILRSQTTKFQYFISPGHQESIFSVPGHYSSLTLHKSLMYNCSLKTNSPKRGGGYAALLRFGK